MGEMDFTKLGLMIKYERRRLHLTQEELAKDIGMTKAVLGQVERGERTITVERLIKLANRLGVSVDYLLNDYTHSEDSQIIREFRAMIYGQPIERKRMAMDILRPIFYYFENNDDKK